MVLEKLSTGTEKMLSEIHLSKIRETEKQLQKKKVRLLNSLHGLITFFFLIFRVAPVAYGSS